MRVTLATSVAILALAAPAQGADKYEWGFIESRGEARLHYAVPESDILTIVFACDPKKKRIEIVTDVLPLKPKSGQPLKTTLVNGKITTAYDGKVGSYSEDFHFEASTAAEPKVVDILKSGTTLTIGIPGKQVRVPLKGVAKPLAQFEAACFGKN